MAKKTYTLANGERKTYIYPTSALWLNNDLVKELRQTAKDDGRVFIVFVARLLRDALDRHKKKSK